MRDLLTTNIRLPKSFNFLTHSLKVYCVAQKDPRANFVDEPGSATGSGSTAFSPMVVGNCGGHYPVCLLQTTSLPMTQVIVAHIL